MPNQALEQTRDSVLRYGEVVGCELLNFFVRQHEAQSQSRVNHSSFDAARSASLIPVVLAQPNSPVPTRASIQTDGL
jgi:hypothetical protein